MRSYILPSLVGGAVVAAASATAKVTTRGANAFGEVEMVAASWYTGWHVESMGVDAIPWDKYTHDTYAFA